MSWSDYQVIVETPILDGLVAHQFDRDWSDEIWPRWYIQGLLDNFFQQHVEPPTHNLECVALHKIENSGWKVDALPQSRYGAVVRVLGPMPPEMFERACDITPVVQTELEIAPLH
jgi:hypothetical protein